MTKEEPQIRRVLRMLFTKEAKALKEMLKAPDVQLIQVNIHFEALTSRYQKLCAANDEMLTEMLTKQFSDDELAAELTRMNEYDLVYMELKEMVKVVQPVPPDTKPGLPPIASPTHLCDANSAKFRRPKLDIKQFDGNLRNWIQFWTQYSKHHEDESLSDDEKFELLLQYLKPGSPAYKTIEKYPPSGDNYGDAVALLRSRYGKDELLIEFYMRELLNLVLRKQEDVPLTRLYDDLEGHLRALRSLGVTSDKCAAMVFPLVESAIPEEVFKVWERHRVQKSSSMKDPETCLSELLNFLKLEVEGEQRQRLRRGMLGLPENKTNVDGKSSPTLLTTGKAKNQCIFCDRLTHASQDCAVAADASLDQRVDTIKKKGGCFKCLQRGHLGSKCRIFLKCPVCKGRHFALMCEKINATDESPRQEMAETTTTAAAISPIFKPIQVTYLQTLVARIKVGDNDRQLVRILCDSGSQRSYIVKSCAMKAGLRPIGTVSLSQELFGGNKTAIKSYNNYQLVLKSLSNGQKCKIRVLETNKICEGVPRLQDEKLYHVLKGKGIELSDFSGLFNDVSDEVQVLLGADVWAQLVSPEFMKVTEDLMAIKTTLGWTLVGTQQEHDSTLAMQSLVTLTCSTRLPDLWELEAMGLEDSGVKQSKEEADRQVTEFFNSTVKREASGRYVVRLPWLKGHPTLESNFNSAKNRLYSTTKKLNNTGKYNDYNQVFQEWLKMDIIEKIEPDDHDNMVHYLPHRPVFKEGSTTKTRPVFDASNKDRHGRSLNDCLSTGPNLIELLPFVLMNFRMKKIGLVADVEKAFLQISIEEAERDMLRFLWWEEKEMVIFRHRRVVFGVCCSPFLLASVLNHHLSHAPDSYSDIAEELRQAFYVDNCLTGVSREDEVETFITRSQDLLGQAGFNLRGWVNPLVMGPQHVEKVLGLEWHCGTDEFSCSIQPVTICQVTRQVILSTAHKVFDPMGFWAPFTLLPKILLQRTWELKVDWNDPLPDEVTSPFYAWAEQLGELKQCQVPRRLMFNQSSTMHVFVDASQQGYGACIFLRTEDGGIVHTGLVLAKAKVAPLRKLTLPRLELMAAWLGAKLSQLALKCLKTTKIPVHYWSDAAVVLAWLTRPGSWGVFVENRVRDIHAITNAAPWRHVPGVLNPADLLSRGCSVKQLMASRWWEGPLWLSTVDEDKWPVKDPQPDPLEVEKEKRKSVVLACGVVADSLLGQLVERFLSYTKIVKTIAFILRLRKDSFRKFTDKTVGPQEFEAVERKLFLWIQKGCFCNDGDTSSDLKNLEIFKDNEGLLRMKSRVIDASDTQAYTYPVILPANHPIVDRMVEELHRTYRHVGTQTLLLLLRERVWLVRGRKTVARIIRKCVICRRYQAKALETPVPPLPEDRTRLGKAFQVTGTDLAGPLLLKNAEKCWIVIYTCATYRAVHLELITSLSSVAYAQALRRFIARRGRMEVLYSDNGTNFVGLNKAMNQLEWEDMNALCGTLKINWKFNPPTASWWGGFWERLIRILKDLLYKNLKHANLSYEEMNTLLCECEYLMNSRPLTYLSEDGLELQPLRPFMFLQDITNGSTSDLDEVQGACLVEKWKYIQTIRSHLRSRFKKEYLGFLRHNVKTKRGSISVGDIVLIGSENQKRVDWPLARVIKIMPGKDDVTRLAQLKTATGVLTRPVQRLYPLEVRHENCIQSDPLAGAVSDGQTVEDGSVPGKEEASQEDIHTEDFSEDCHSGEELDDPQPELSPMAPLCSRSGRLIKKRDVLDL